MNEFWIGLGVAVVGALFTWWLASLTARRANAEAERAALQMQADALIVAVVGVRGLADTNRLLWEGWPARRRTILLSFMAALGGTARAVLAARTAKDAVGWLPLLAGLGAAAHPMGSDLRQAKRAVASVTSAGTRVATAAAPLLRHPDPQVAATTLALLSAVSDIESSAVLDRAMDEFGRAVARALEARPRWWRRVLPGRHQAEVRG